MFRNLLSNLYRGSNSSNAIKKFCVSLILNLRSIELKKEPLRKETVFTFNRVHLVSLS